VAHACRRVPRCYIQRAPLNLPMGTGGLGYGARARSVNEFVTVRGVLDCIKYCATLLLDYGGISGLPPPRR
jgi:hypothetical protein